MRIIAIANIGEAVGKTIASGRVTDHRLMVPIYERAACDRKRERKRIEENLLGDVEWREKQTAFYQSTDMRGLKKPDSAQEDPELFKDKYVTGRYKE